MYDLIKNPNTNRYVSIHGNLGRSILRNYLYTSHIGGGTLGNVKAATTATVKNLGAKAAAATGKLRDGAVKGLNVDVKKNIKEIIQSGVKLIEQSDFQNLKNSIIDNVTYQLFLVMSNLISVSLDTDLKKYQQGTKSQTELKEKVAMVEASLMDVVNYWTNFNEQLMFYGTRLKDVYTELKSNNDNEINKKIKKNKNALGMIYYFNYLQKILSLFANIKEKINIYQNYNDKMRPLPWKNIDQLLENARIILRKQIMLSSALYGIDVLMEAYDPNVDEDQKNLELINSVVNIQPAKARIQVK